MTTPTNFDHGQFLSDFGRMSGQRQDAGETAALPRQLEHVYAKTYDIKYPDKKARKLIPVDLSVDAAAGFFSYQQWDSIGMAKIISNYAEDLPQTDVAAKEFVTKLHSLGSSYTYSIMDLRRSAKTGSQLDAKKAMAARRAHEQAVEDIAAVGNAEAGLGGFTNHANVPLVAATVGQWVTNIATPLQMLADLDVLVNSVVTATKETFLPDTLVLPGPVFQLLNSTYMSADNNKTVLKAFLENNAYISGIEQWYKCDDAGALGVSRTVCYKRDEEVLALVIPQEFEQFPPQARNLAFEVSCHSRIGGVRVQYPLAIAYMDDLDG